jgi:hypothetical protein
MLTASTTSILSQNVSFWEASEACPACFACPATLNLYEKADLGPLFPKLFPKPTGFGNRSLSSDFPVSGGLQNFIYKDSDF